MDQLIVTDLDGTLLRSDRSLSAYTVHVLNGAIAAGVAVTYATARSYYTASRLLAAVDFQLPAIVFNGAMVIDPADGSRLVENVLDPSIAAEVVAHGVGRHLPPFVFGFAAGEEVAVHAAPVNDGQRLWLEERQGQGDRRLRPVRDVRPPDEVVAVQFIGPANELGELSDWVHETFGDGVATSMYRDVYTPDCHHFEVYHPRASKKDMVRWVAGHLAVPLSGVAVIGDNHNDLPMFAIAGRRLAVANAHADVLAAADQVLAANDADGVAIYVASVVGAAAPTEAPGDAPAPRRQRSLGRRGGAVGSGGHRLAAGVVIAVDGRVLLVKDAGGWSLPKGSPGPGETLAEAALREAREETGLRVSIGEVAFVTEFRSARWGLYLQVYFAATVDPDPEASGPVSDADVTEVRWVSRDDLDDHLRFPPWLVPLRAWLETSGLHYHSFDEDGTGER